MVEKLTSTFTIHHDVCDMSKWTLGDFQLLVEFMRTRSLSTAAALSRRGVQLVLSENHEPKGGTLERIGIAHEGNLSEFVDFVSELDDLEDNEVSPVVAVYRGPTRFAVAYGIGDDEGNYEGTEYEIFDTEDEARKFARSFDEARAPGGSKASAPASAEPVNPTSSDSVNPNPGTLEAQNK